MSYADFGYSGSGGWNPDDWGYGPRAKPRSQNSDRVNLTPDQQQSLLSSIISAGGSALQTTGNILDTPGSIVRGLLAGEPGRAFGGIFDTEQRVKPEELTGLTSDENDDWLTKTGKFLGNTGASVVTDPLFWASAGILPGASKGLSALKGVGLLGKGERVAQIMGEAGIGAREAGMATKFGEILPKLLDRLPDAEKVAKTTALDTYLKKLGTTTGELADKPLSGLFNIGPLGGGGRNPWATVGTGPIAQKIAGMEDLLGGKIRTFAPVRYANALLNQGGTQGMTSVIGQSAAPAFTAAEDAAKTYSHGTATDINQILSAAPEAPRAAKLRLMDALPGPDLDAAMQEITGKYGWTPDQAQKFRDTFDNLRTQEAATKMGANAKELSSPYAAYTSRRAVPGAFEPDVLGGTGMRNRGLIAGDASDISRNLALDLPGGQARVEEFFSDPDLAAVAKLGQSLPTGLKDEEFAKAIQKSGKYNDIPDFYLDQKGWMKVRRYAEKVDPQDEYGTLQNALAEPDKLKDLARAADVETKKRFPELAHVFLRLSKEGREAGLFGEPIEQIAGRMASNQAMRVAHGNLLANMLTSPGALSEEGIVTRTGPQGGSDIFRPTAQIKPATVGDIASQASLLHGSEDEGFLQYIARKMGVDPADKDAMKVLKESAVEPSIARDIAGFHKRFDAPESTNKLLSAIDQATALFKTGVLSRPSFTTRAETSHTIQGALHGMFSGTGNVQMAKFLSGGELSPEAFAKIPAFQDQAVKMGIGDLATASPDEVRNVVSALTNKEWGGRLHGATSPYVNEGLGKTSADYTAQQIGGTPITPGSIFNKFIGRNPAASGYVDSLAQGAKGMAQDVMAGDPATALNKFGPVAAMHEANNFTMNHPRLAAWYGLMEKGYDPSVARQMVEDKMFTYGAKSFTPFENKVLKRVFPFYCVPVDDTEILTQEGWKRCDDLTVGESVLTYNIDKDGLEWQNCEGKSVFDFDEEITVLANCFKMFRCTAEHRWPVYIPPARPINPLPRGERSRGPIAYRNKARRVIRETDKLKGGCAIIQSAALILSNVESILSPESARLLGWLLTDGAYRWRSDTRKSPSLNKIIGRPKRGMSKTTWPPEADRPYLEAVLYQHPKKFLAEVIALAGGKIRKPHRQTGCVSVAITKDRLLPLREHLRYGKNDKYWVQLVCRLSREAAEAMYDAMYKGDGTTRPTRTQDMFACSAHKDGVGEAFVVLATLLGRTLKANNRGFYVSKHRYIHVGNMKIKTEPYRGRVWCPQTSNGTWVMRQNGVVTITGNSFGKQATATTLKELAERPGGPTGQVIKATANITDNDSNLLPDYIKQGMAIPIPEGTPLIGPEPGGMPRYLTTVGMMHERYPFAFMGQGLQGAGLETLAQTNPLIKFLVEGATGTSTFQRGPGGPRELSEQDPLLGRLISNISDTITGEQTPHAARVPYLENILANSPASAALTAARTAFDPRKSLASKAINLLSGAKVTDVTPAAEQAMQQELLAEMMKEGGARSYENVYFPKDELLAMGPEQRLKALQLQAYNALLAKKERARAKLRKAVIPAVP